METLQKEAEKLAEEWKLAREQAMQWTQEVKANSDKEREWKPKKTCKPKQDMGSGDEAEPKKKRHGKLKKPTSDGHGEVQAVFSKEEETEKPTKKRCIMKAVVKNEGEEETTQVPFKPKPRKKQKEFKSLENSLAQLNTEHVDLLNELVKSRLRNEEMEEELVRYKLL
ncbi:hypothetical protein DXG01_005520 [Tephrocybe rancida]|nr:hypothetical protein DXG01_005520 [Tephrocybe rancida]